MTEQTIVRENLMTREEYTPYCGNDISRDHVGGCDNPRTVFRENQFVCTKCGWRSNFPKDFIDRYKLKWNK